MNQTIGVNITPQSFQPTLHYSQGDVGRVFVVNVTDYDIPSGATVTCVATKPSGMGFTVSGTVSGNSVTFTSTAEMTDEWGRFPAEIRIASGNTLLGTANFLMIGEKDPHPASTIDGTQEELIPQLTLLVNRVEAAAESVHDLTVSATTLTAGSDATATYDSTNNSIAFGIPRGADGDVTRSEFNDLKSDLSSYEVLNDNRFVFSKNLFDSASAVFNYYVDASTGNLISYSGWFATPYLPVDGSSEYSYLILESGQNWSRPSGVYYAFYDSQQRFTHGGVSASNANIACRSGDAFFRGSWYSGSYETTMFGLASDMASYLGTAKEKMTFYVAPKYNSDPYRGLLEAFIQVKNPYYSLRVSGNRIATTQDGYIEGAFIKFDSISVWAQNGLKTKSWASFKTDIQNDPYIEITTAFDETADTLRLLPEHGVVYNYLTNTYHVKNKVYITGLTQHEVIVFYIDANSNPSGVLYDAWANNHKQGIEKYIRTIESRETDLLDYGDNFVFAFATDCHWYFDNTAYHNYTNEMVEELRNCIGFDCYINGGDSIYYGTEFKLNGIASMTEAFEVDHDNYVYCIGNHDYNGVSTGDTQNSSWMFDANGIESLCLRKMKNIHRPDGARYYYRDFEDKKIRVIVLDTSDLDITFDSSGALTTPDPLVTFVVRKAQVDWLCDALDCPDSDWGVIVVMHVGLYLAEDGFIDNNPLSNRSAVIEVLKKYVSKSAYSYSTSSSFPISGSGTFENSKGHLIGVWSGHAHADGYCNKDGFNAIQTECGYPDSASRVVGTIDEICVDCVCVDMTANTITLKRFGSGSDRAYTFV